MSKMLRVFIGMTLVAASAGATAQSAAWPARPVTMIVPFAAGGSVDIAARIVGTRLAEVLGQPIVVENAPGAAGTIGTLKAVRATADGYTLLFAVATPVNVAPVVSPSMVRYDALKELAPLARVSTSTFVLVGRATLPAPDAAALVQHAKQNPGKLNSGIDGVGGSIHLATELIKLQAGIDLQTVVYKSGPQMITELAGGQIDLAVAPVALAQPFIRDGKIRAYGVLSKPRTSALPNVPSLSEAAAFRDLDERSWYGMFAPAGTDATIVARLSGAITQVVAEAAVVTKLDNVGHAAAPLPAAEFGKLVRDERQTVVRIVEAAKIKVQ